MDVPTAAGLALGAVADGLLGDPRRRHPVAGFGSLALALERRLWRDGRARGVVHVAVLVGGGAEGQPRGGGDVTRGEHGGHRANRAARRRP